MSFIFIQRSEHCLKAMAHDCSGGYPGPLAVDPISRQTLAQIAGREMIARVWDQVVMTPSVDQTVVATDSDKIAAFCQENDMDVVMTRSDHATGSDRLAEVAEKISADIYERAR